MASGQDKKATEQCATAILMATFNGGSYLREQLDSLFTQSSKDWTLFVHDDGSNDDTRQILDEYAGKHPNMRVLDYESQHGACANFLSLLERVEAERYFFCDQDDVWDTDKVRYSLNELKRLEKAAPGAPVVVHSDLLVTDEQLQVIDTSFFRYTGLHPERLSTFETSVLPFVTGCTMLFNRGARDAVLRHKGRPTMHDVWTVLCTLREGGQVALIPKPLVSYRQHVSNTLGARDIRQVGIAYRLRHLRVILHDNARHYAMLRDLGYGSTLKFIVQRIKYNLKG